MIVRPRPHWIRLLFARRGSLIVRILQQQLFILLLSSVVVAFHGQLFHWKVTLTSAPFSLMGVALAIFLGFRINVSYERYWEARRLWGVVLVEARNLARQVLTLPGIAHEARPFVLGLTGFATTMRNQLRCLPRGHALEGLLPSALIERLHDARFAPALVLLWLGENVRRWREAGHIDAMAAQQIECSLNELSGALGGCERIATTPMPFTYSVILHRSAYLYCMLLPFGLIDTIGIMTPLIVAFVSYTFFALEALSDEIEDPFGTMPNDLALDAMVVGIDASLREMLGDPLPPVPRPDANFVLT